MKIGFTGPSGGMSPAQLIQVHMLLGDLQSAGATQVTHGLCIGGDEQFHDQARGFGYFIIGCPGVTDKGKPYKRSDRPCDLVMPAKPFLVRNRDIVAESDVLIATPEQVEEQWKGSGTWATIRYARRARKPLCIVWSDGSGPVENVPGVATLNEYRQSIALLAMGAEASPPPPFRQGGWVRYHKDTE